MQRQDVTADRSNVRTISDRADNNDNTNPVLRLQIEKLDRQRHASDSEARSWKAEDLKHDSDR